MTKVHQIVVAALTVLLATPTLAETTAFVGAHLIPIDGPEIPDGTLIVVDGVIKSVGPRAEVKVPNEAITIDAAGMHIMPGLVDTHSHIGGSRAADQSGPIQPGVRISDGLNVFDAGFRRALAGGLTTINVMPGSGYLSSGQTIYLKLRRTGTGSGVTEPKDMAYLTEDGSLMGGLKMANGTNSRGKAPFPGTRAKAVYLVREKFIQAQEYAAKIEAADGDESKLPPRDLDLEILVEVLRGERVVHHHTHRADDIMSVIRLSEEFGFKVVLQHVSEGWKVAAEIAAAGLPCSVIMIDSPGGKLEAVDLKFRTGKVLHDAGVLIAYHTDDWINDSRLFLRSAALGMRGGLDRDTALASLTINGAIMLGLEDRIGSLTPGKDADFVILDGDPMSTYSRVRQTWVEGQKVFDYSDAADRLHAEGGQGATQNMTPYMCCITEGGES